MRWPGTPSNASVRGAGVGSFAVSRRDPPLPGEDRPKSNGPWEDEDAETKGALCRGRVEPAGTAQNEGQGNQDPNEPVNTDKGHK